MTRHAKIAWKWGVAIPLFLIYVALAFAPAWIWFDSRSIKVSDTVSGRAATVVEDRYIRFSFFGSFTANVRHAAGPQEVAGRCYGTFDFPYRGGLIGRKSYNLVEFVGSPSCRRLAPGPYYVEVCRTVKRPIWGILPPKTSCWTSNVFTVRSEE